MATGPIETHLHRSFNWENGAPGPQEGPRGRSANCGNGLSAQCVRLRSEINQYTTAGSKNLQIVDFGSVQIGPLGVNELDNNRQAQFTYYIRECDADKNDGTKHEGYKNDTKTFKVVVTAKDKGDGTLECTPTYYEVDASGHESATPTFNPTFTNTYSTSLPLSGMSGVTLTYLAGAAVLCAAAAWMHIRRKANAKGGERRE